MENNDKEFLNWIYERMICVHGEKDLYDYMINFKSIIDRSSSVAAPKEEEVKDVYVLIDELHADADYLLSRAIQKPEDKAMLVKSVREKLNLIRQLAVPETTVTDGIKIIKLMTELASLRQQLKEREELIANLKQDITRLIEDVNKAYDH